MAMIAQARKIKINNYKLQAYIIWGNDIDDEEPEDVLSKPAGGEALSILRGL